MRWKRLGTKRGKEWRKEAGKAKKRDRSDNLKLNSHHVSVEQNSIVFIGSPQPEGNYILKQCMAWMHTHLSEHTHACRHTHTNAEASTHIHSAQHCACPWTKPPPPQKKKPLADVSMQTSGLSPKVHVPFAQCMCMCVCLSTWLFTCLCACVCVYLPGSFSSWHARLCTKVYSKLCLLDVQFFCLSATIAARRVFAIAVHTGAQVFMIVARVL